jgi:hypothetical protein
MRKAICGSLVLVLMLPATGMAESRFVAARHLPPLRAQPRAAVTATQAAPPAQPPPERSWAARHPAALGAMIGAAAGAVVGAYPCWKTVCGDGHGPLLVGFGAGLGAGIGAGVGFGISLAKR